jgi:hypothetical protein
MNEMIKSTTRGPFIVSTSVVKGSLDRRTHISVVQANHPRRIVALTGIEGEADESESIANAALFAVSDLMLETLIDVQMELNTAKVIDIEKVNEMISEVFARLANEAGEEL